jgi:hypothetical protein
VTGISVPPGRLRLETRGRRIASRFEELPVVGPARQRVGDLVAHVVAAHAAALERIVELAERTEVLEDDPDVAEVLWVHRPTVEGAEAVDRYGTRIDALVTALEQSVAPAVADVAADLAGEVGELYGETIGRAFELLHESGQAASIRAALADDLVASLLVVHGLHPDGLHERVAACLVALTESLPEHGGQVHLVGVDEAGVVTVEISGGSDLHRWRTRLAAERAIERAAPDHGGIVVRGAESEPVAAAPLVSYIPLDQVRRRGSRPTSAPGPGARVVGGRWVELPGLVDIADGAVCRVVADEVAFVACNVDGDLYVTVDPDADADGASSDPMRLVARRPPTVAVGDGRHLVIDAPLTVQRTVGSVEVRLP